MIEGAARRIQLLNPYLVVYKFTSLRYKNYMDRAFSG